MPLMFLKMAVMRFLPLLICAAVLFVGAIVGVCFALDGWQVFFSILGITILSLFLVGFLIYRSVKKQISEQMQMMQNMMNGMNGVAGAFTSKGKVIDVPAHIKDVKDGATSLIGMGTGVAATAAAVTAVSANESVPVVEGSQVQTTSSELEQVDEAMSMENMDLEVMMQQALGQMTPEQQAAAQKMAMQMMQMFMGGGSAEGGEDGEGGIDLAALMQQMSQADVEDVAVKNETVATDAGEKK